MHGDVDALEKANGVRKSDVWFLLNGKNPSCYWFPKLLDL